MTITSINLPPKHQKMLAEVLKARGFPERGRSAYFRACIEADYLDLKQQRDVDRHNARIFHLTATRRKAPTQGKTK